MWRRLTVRLIKYKAMKQKKDIEFPECWEEVKPLEWVHLLKIRDKLMKKPGISLRDVKRDWCAYVLKNRGYRLGGVDDMLMIDRLTDTLDWMWMIGEDTGLDGVTVTEAQLTYDCTVNLLPKWRYLQGPASHGADLTFGEFRQAAAVMNQYNAGQNPADLRALCAILYRKPVKEKGCVNRSGRNIWGGTWDWCAICRSGFSGEFMLGLLTSVITCLSVRSSLKGWRFALHRFLNGTGRARRLNLVLFRT